MVTSAILFGAEVVGVAIALQLSRFKTFFGASFCKDQWI
jgi:hypothetical protein